MAGQTRNVRRRTSSALSASVGVCAVLCCAQLWQKPNEESSAAFAAPALSSGLDRHAEVGLTGKVGINLRELPKPAKVTREVLIGQTLNAVPETRHIREWIQHPLRWLGRMEERWIGPFNGDRQGMRLSAQDTYAGVAAFVMGVVLGLYGCVSDVDEDATPMQKRLYEAQMALLSLATLASSFTMIIFLLSKVYSVTALGLWKDVAYSTFHAVTSSLRMQAFWGLIISTTAMMYAFCLNLIEKIKGPRGLVCAGVAALMSTYFTYQFWFMTDLAYKFVFSTYPGVYPKIA